MYQLPKMLMSSPSCILLEFVLLMNLVGNSILSGRCLFQLCNLCLCLKQIFSPELERPRLECTPQAQRSKGYGVGSACHSGMLAGN
jgi:hypothetical protein